MKRHETIDNKRYAKFEINWPWFYDVVMTQKSFEIILKNSSRYHVKIPRNTQNP